MYLSLKWLQQFLPEFEAKDLDRLKDKLDTRLSEVEAITPMGEALSKLVIGEILSFKPHPTNDKLTVCLVNTGESEPRTIVCGAPNVREGLKSVVCLPGGQVLAGGKPMQITERKMGEVVSQGMICAPDELGMSDDHSQIIELPASTKVGEDVTELFKDAVIEIENKALPHRPDAFSHLGIAREISAIFEIDLHNPATSKVDPDSEKELLPLEIAIDNQELCPRFSAIVMDNVRIEPSPLWLQIKLSYAGVRPINNVVDVTNYVMMHMGQPMHAFDYDKLPKPELTAKLAKAQEEVATLDGKTRELTNQIMVVSSNGIAESVAGIMGGAVTQITNSTTRIVVEAANWEMYQIRRASRELGLRSEASTRFEKGISPELTVPAINQAVSLISDITGAEVASALKDIYPNPQQDKKIEFSLNSVKRLLGIEIEKSTILQLLEKIGIEIKGAEKISATEIHSPDLETKVELTIPKHRRDLNIKEDIVEEIGRLYGYENVPLTLPKRDLRPPKTSKFMVMTRELKQALAVSGLTEIYTYSMVGEELYQTALASTKGLWEIPLPISPELKFVRDSILPSLLSKVKQNISIYDQVGLFEISRVALTTKENGLPKQPHKLSMVVTATTELEAYRQAMRALEVVSKIMTGGELTTTNAHTGNLFHPSKSGEIMLEGKKVGEVGVVHPLVVDNLDLPGVKLAGFELDYDHLIGFPLSINSYKPVSNFQPVKRDVNYWLDQDSLVGGHLAKVVSDIPEVIDARFVDIYTENGAKTRVTLRYVLQAVDHTLSQDEILALMAKITKSAASFGLELR
jgi:phenylalanyl-tRNA synthetase beta chain